MTKLLLERLLVSNTQSPKAATALHGMSFTANAANFTIATGKARKINSARSAWSST
jgi:hypothetical protein